MLHLIGLASYIGNDVVSSLSRIDTLAIDRKPPGMAHTGAYNTGIMLSEKDTLTDPGSLAQSEACMRPS